MQKPEIVLLSGNDIFANDLAAVAISKMLFDHGKRSNIIHIENVLQFICMNIIRDGKWCLEVSNPEECFWMDYIIPYLEKFYDRWDFVIFPDLKFEDEIRLLVNNGYRCHAILIGNNKDEWTFSGCEPNMVISPCNDHEKFSHNISVLVGAILLDNLKQNAGHF